MSDELIISDNKQADNIKDAIYEIRGQKVMLDRDLAVIYGVETRILNQAVKRNLDRFPSDFMFQLTKEEWRDIENNSIISSQIVMTSPQRRPKTATPDERDGNESVYCHASGNHHDAFG